jgi:hypothetical protein
MARRDDLMAARSPRTDTPRPADYPNRDSVAMTRLLGHLAQFNAFSNQGEVLCTQGLAYFLREHPDARAALAAEIASRTGLTLPDDLHWRTEAVQDCDGGRPDLEACRTDSTPVVKIEAKLGAPFGDGQLRSYLDALRSQPHESVLAILVPSRRVQEARGTIAEEFGAAGQDPWRPADSPNVVVTTISWEAVLKALAACDDTPLRSEVEQFAAMYDVLNDGYIEPLAGREDLIQWRKREDATGTFTKLVDRLTHELPGDRRINPMGREALERTPDGLEPRAYRRRYVCEPQDASGQQSCFSIGVRDPFSGFETPIWLRFHRDTPRFEAIRIRLESSGVTKVASGGHIWIPLDIPVGVGEEDMLKALLSQTQEIVRIAFGR